MKGLTKLYYVIYIFIHFVLTLLMIYDFFPELVNIIDIPHNILVSIMLFTFLLGILVGGKKKDTNKTDTFVNIASMLYLILLVLVLTILGGVSQVGISLSNPVTWLLVVLTIVGVLKKDKKSRVQDNYNN
ncbi:hypothetical protein LYSIN_01235 [Lysinibacillus sphaericus]|uniref:Uncharacterized protein n=1 Tax=Lysinibacillus sphaericus TaxID=1421 RepID=A0A2S5D0B4_LYSSH|nr:hypothetical protein [Lysinibacillus sphaericus]POZ56452.1 hypothetical protein LYSIN_01235 [Lysinibacillus sphaericus]